MDISEVHGRTRQPLKMASLVGVKDSDNSENLHDTNFNVRRLESVNDPSCPSASSWRRSFLPLNSSKTERGNGPASCQYKEDLSVGSAPKPITLPTDLDAPNSPSQHHEDSFLIEECSVSTPDCDSWHGFVTIGSDLSGCSSPSSPDSGVAKAEISVSMTPPRSKKKKAKKKQSIRSSHSPPSSPVLPWGDLATINEFHRFHQSIEELGSPGVTPKKTRRKKLRLKSSPDFAGCNYPSDGIVGPWDDLLEPTPMEDSSRFETVNVNVAPMEPDCLLQALEPSSPHALPGALSPRTEGNESFLDRFRSLYDSSEKDNNCLKEDLIKSQESENPVSESISSEHQHSRNDEVQDKPPRRRLIRFADEQGLPIEKIYQIGNETQGGTMGRIVVLLVDPLVKKFEFLQGEYSPEAGTTVADLLKQLPSFAVDQWFANKEYDSLYGTKDGPRELQTTDRLDQLDLAKRETTVAVARGVSGVQLVNDAAPILSNDEIIKAVKKAIRIGRGIKYIKSRMEMEVEDETEVEVDDIDLCQVDFDFPENLVFESRQLKYNQEPQKKGRLYPPPFIDLYDSNDHVPTLDDNSVFPDQRDVLLYYEADHNPHRVIKFLHASLLATIGIAYSLMTK